MTAPDQELEPLYKLVQQDQRRRFLVWGRDLLLWAPVVNGTVQIVTCIYLVNTRRGINLMLD